MNLNTIIENLKESGVVDVDDYKGSLEDLQERLKLKGYSTSIVVKEKMFLQLVQ